MKNSLRAIDTDLLIFLGEPGREGKRWPYAFNKVWADVTKHAKVPDMHFHDLRHEAVSRFVEAIHLRRRAA